MDETPADRLRQARVKAGFARPSAAADRFGWNRETYKSHENGMRGIRADAALRYARAFKVSQAWILTGETGGSVPPPAASEHGSELGDAAELVRDCIIAVEELLEERGDHRSVEERADLVARLFDQEIRAKEKGARPVSGAAILRLVRRA